MKLSGPGIQTSTAWSIGAPSAGSARWRSTARRGGGRGRPVSARQTPAASGPETRTIPTAARPAAVAGA